MNTYKRITKEKAAPMWSISGILAGAALVCALLILVPPAFAEDAISAQADEGVAVYRLYNDVTSEHLFTTSRGEAVTLANNYSEWNWLYEGVSWVAPSSGTPVHRLYNPYLGHHLYTSSSVEIASLVAHWDWNDEGVFFYSGGAQSIYRLYNPYLYGLHLITTSAHEYSMLPAHQWNQEGEVFQSLGDASAVSADKQLTWVTDYEQKWVTSVVTVVDSAAWDEQVPVYSYEDCAVCWQCGANITGNITAHQKEHARAGESGAWRIETLKVITGYDTIHHDAVTHSETQGSYQPVAVGGHWE